MVDGWILCECTVGRYLVFCLVFHLAGGNSCNLCLEEKLKILRSYNSRSNLNKRSEIFMKCVHARRFHAGRFKRTRVSKHCEYSKTQQLNRINMLPDDCLLHET